MKLTVSKPQVSLPTSRIGLDQATAMYADMEFHELLNMAQARRKAMVPGNHVTYLVDRNINYTNACTINCQFCSFYRPPDHPEAYTQTVDEISERISALEEVGGTRILMQGGVNPDLPLEWYTQLISELRVRHPGIAFDCFSPIEIEGISKVSSKTTSEVLTVLKEAGMTGLPGGGAEMLVDNVRLDVSPIKGSSDRWIEVMREAQRLDLTTSATNVFGFGETLRQRIEHLDRIRNLQDEAISEGRRGFTSFIAWPVQLENNSFGLRNRGRNKIEKGAGPIDYLRHLAISRLYLDNISPVSYTHLTLPTILRV